jgi:hypothetical protein
MRAGRKNDQLVLQFGAMEKEILLQTVQAILHNYQLKPGELDAKTAAIWYSTRGCKSAGMSAEETAEWLDSLHSFKSANAKFLEQWCRQIKQVEPGKFELAVKVKDAATLVSVINDHRLHLAAKHEIGQEEMDQRWSAGEEKELSPERQSALVQIELLGWLIEVILRLVAPEAASWSDVLESPDELA